jgi:hypothetical protein
MGVAVEILLLARLEPEIHMGDKFTPPLCVNVRKKPCVGHVTEIIASCIKLTLV